MSKYGKLISNSFIFAIGNLGSKLINIILVPLYTFYLTSEEYGSTDILFTTVSILVPILSFSMYDAVLRYVMDKDYDKASVLTNTFFICVFGLLLGLIFYPVLVYFRIFSGLLHYLYFLLIFQVIERLFAQFSRGIGLVKVFALNGILLTFSTGILNIFFLAYLKLGVSGYLVSTCIAYLVSIIFLFWKSNIKKYIDVKRINKGLLKVLILYSIPLIPNALMWIIINASSKYFILYFVGLSANGLFAVASRIPTLINMVSQIFTQAWQLSAIEEYDNSDSSNFYSNVFNSYISVMFIGASFIIITIKPLFQMVLANEYYDAWIVVPFLVIGTVFSSFSGFLGAIYIAVKKTSGVFLTSVYGGGTSLFFNLLLIPKFGLIGAGVSSMMGFFVMFLLRFNDTNKYSEILINKKQFVINLILIFLQILILNIQIIMFWELIYTFSLFFILLLTNKDVIIHFGLFAKDFLNNFKK